MQIAELIAQTKTAIAESQAEADRLGNVILGEGFVVKCERVYLAFDIDSALRVTNPRMTRAHLATRFTRGDAKRVAMTVKNGHGTVGEVQHVRDAIGEEIEEQRLLLATLEAHQAAESQRFAVKARA